MTNGQPPILEVTDLCVLIRAARGLVQAVRGVSLSISEGEILGLVGESGCGKSMTAMSIAGLAPDFAEVSATRMVLAGKDMRDAHQEDWRAVRRDTVGFVFQNPMKALNPRMIVARQLREAMLPEERRDVQDYYARALELLDWVGIDRPTERLRQYPHELSGGLAQRVVIALALARRPKLLIADEPTTALDVSVQEQILNLIDRLRDELGLAVLLVSHDLHVIRDRADRVAVMYAGRIVECGPTAAVIDGPTHPYSAALIAAMPNVARPREKPLVGLEGAPPSLIDPPVGCAFRLRCPLRTAQCEAVDPTLVATSDANHVVACWNSGGGSLDAELEPPAERLDDLAEHARASSVPIVEAVQVSKSFASGALRWPWHARTSRRAVRDVSVAVREGESLGVVGESGSGKTTLARMLVGLESPEGGRILYDGKALNGLTQDGRSAWRRDVQFVFQDSSSSLNPRMTIAESIGEPLRAQGVGLAERQQQVLRLLRDVGMDDSFADRRPHQLSGGQRQRVGIARALALRPRLIIADEPVSALDVSVQATILNLMRRLRVERRMSYLVISHDLGVINYICSRVVVIYRGEIVEQGDVHEVLSNPQHDYTRQLLRAVPGGRTLVRDRLRPTVREPAAILES